MRRPRRAGSRRRIWVGRALGPQQAHDHQHARAGALGLGNDVAWVEKIKFATKSMVDDETLAAREDAIGELQRMLHDARTDVDLVKQLQNDIGELTSRLPHDTRNEVDDDILQAAIDGDYATLVDKVVPYLTSRLTVQENLVCVCNVSI